MDQKNNSDMRMNNHFKTTEHWIVKCDIYKKAAHKRLLKKGSAIEPLIRLFELKSTSYFNIGL